MVPNRTANSCFDEETILALLAGEISAAARAPIDEHLASCAACGRLIAAAAGGSDAPEVSEPGEGKQVGRYHVLGPLGAGGIGIVYAARDPDLDRPVAIKLLRPESGGEGSRARVLREAQAMARLAHPNVVAIYDVGTWRDQVFIAMELIVGRTLREWLKAQPRAQDEIVATCLQAGRGLAAAHAAGVVHRDFKPDNVLIGDDGRVLVTDFGLARGFEDPLLNHPELSLDRQTTPRPPNKVLLGAQAATPLNSPLTPLGTVAGTPAYMAPEQGRGEPVTAEADIFSFCTALYESLYGDEPFPAPSAVARVRRIEANDVAPAPAKSRVRPGLRKLLLRGLRAEPRERFPSMESLLRAFESERRSRLIRRGAAAAAVVAIAIVTAVGARAFLHQRRLAKLPPGRAAVAILAPENRAGAGSEWLGEAFTELLDTSLRQSARMRVIPTETVELAAGAQTDALAKGGVQRIRQRLGADLVVTGEYQRSGDSLTLRLALWNASTGEKLGAESASGNLTDLASIVARAGEDLRVDAGEDSRTASAPPPFRFPKNPEAARLAAEGLRQERSFALPPAIADLQQAVKLEPENPMLLAWLSEALERQNQKPAARAAAEQALTRAQSLSREEQLRIELGAARTAKDLRRAEAIARTLWTLAPDDIEAGLRLCRVYALGGKGKEELGVVDELRKLPAPANLDPRIDLAEAEGAIGVRDGPRAIDAAGRAFKTADQHGLPAVEASALTFQARAEQATGQLDDAARHLAQAGAISEKMGDAFNQLRAQSLYATVVADQGDLPRARTLLEKVAAGYRAEGDVPDEAVQLSNLGILMRRAGDSSAALDYAKRALASFEETSDQNAIGSVLTLMAHLQMDLGDPPAASALYERAIALRRETHSGLLASSLNQYAMVRFEMGEPDAALLLAAEAARVADPSDEADLGQSALARAQVHLSTNQFAAAEQDARDAAQRLRKAHQIDPAVTAEGLLAQSLANEKKLGEAQEAVARAEALFATTRSRLAATDLLNSKAMVETAVRKKLSAQTRGEAEKLLADAKARGDTNTVYSMRLLLARTDLAAGVPGAAQALHDLANEATKIGYQRLARFALKCLREAGHAK